VAVTGITKWPWPMAPTPSAHYLRYATIGSPISPAERLGTEGARADALSIASAHFAVYGQDEGAERLIPSTSCPRLPLEEWIRLETGLTACECARSNAFIHMTFSTTTNSKRHVNSR